MSIVVFYLLDASAGDNKPNMTAMHRNYSGTQMLKAIADMNELRSDCRVSHAAISPQLDGIVVFYLMDESTSDNKPNMTAMHRDYSDTQMLKAIADTNELRLDCRVSHVVMSSQLGGMVGKSGVDSVENGRTPNGEIYDFSKAGRAGKMRASDLTKVHQIK